MASLGARGTLPPSRWAIGEALNHNCEIETALLALGYEHPWQQKRWSVWHDSRYPADFSPDLHQQDRPAEEPSAPAPGKGGHRPRTATLGDFIEVARKAKAKPAGRCT